MKIRTKFKKIGSKWGVFGDYVHICPTFLDPLYLCL